MNSDSSVPSDVYAAVELILNLHSESPTPTKMSEKRKREKRHNSKTHNSKTHNSQTHNSERDEFPFPLDNPPPVEPKDPVRGAILRAVPCFNEDIANLIHSYTPASIFFQWKSRAMNLLAFFKKQKGLLWETTMQHLCLKMFVVALMTWRMETEAHVRHRDLKKSRCPAYDKTLWGNHKVPSLLQPRLQQCWDALRRSYPYSDPDGRFLKRFRTAMIMAIYHFRFYMPYTMDKPLMVSFVDFNPWRHIDDVVDIELLKRWRYSLKVEEGELILYGGTHDGNSVPLVTVRVEKQLRYLYGVARRNSPYCAGIFLDFHQATWRPTSRSGEARWPHDNPYGFLLPDHFYMGHTRYRANTRLEDTPPAICHILFPIHSVDNPPPVKKRRSRRKRSAPKEEHKQTKSKRSRRHCHT